MPRIASNSTTNATISRPIIISVSDTDGQRAEGLVGFLARNGFEAGRIAANIAKLPELLTRPQW
jgi:hypothetical protein